MNTCCFIFNFHDNFSQWTLEPLSSLPKAIQVQLGFELRNTSRQISCSLYKYMFFILDKTKENRLSQNSPYTHSGYNLLLFLKII